MPPDKTLAEAHATIKKLEASIERANKVIGERRAPQKKMSEEIKTLWFVVIFSIVFNLILFGIGAVHMVSNIQQFAETTSSIERLEDEHRTYRDWLMKLHPEVKNHDNH